MLCGVWSWFDQSELHHIGVVLLKRGFAVSEVELPNANEALVKAQLQDLCLVAHELVTPAPQSLGIVQTEGQFIHHLEACTLRVAAEVMVPVARRVDPVRGSSALAFAGLAISACDGAASGVGAVASEGPRAAAATAAS